MSLLALAARQFALIALAVAALHIAVQVMAGFQICAAAGTCPW